MASDIRIKRVYDPPESGGGFRILVDRLWPRGLSKEKTAVALWLKEVAPSDDIRRWFAHESAKWPEFKRRYFKELEGKRKEIGRSLDAQRVAPSPSSSARRTSSIIRPPP